MGYDRAAIRDDGEHAVSARITAADGRLLVVTDTRHAVLTRGHPDSLAVFVRSAGGAGQR